MIKHLIVETGKDSHPDLRKPRGLENLSARYKLAS
jgi:hypothetical protein